MYSSAVPSLLLLLSLIPSVSAASVSSIYITIVIVTLLVILAVIGIRLADSYHVWEQVCGRRLFNRYDEDDGKFEMKAFTGHGFNDNEYDGHVTDDVARGTKKVWGYKQLAEETQQEETFQHPLPPAIPAPTPARGAMSLPPAVSQPLARLAAIMSPRGKRAMSPPPAKEERLVSPRAARAMSPRAARATKQADQIPMSPSEKRRPQERAGTASSSSEQSATPAHVLEQSATPTHVPAGAYHYPAIPQPAYSYPPMQPQVAYHYPPMPAYHYPAQAGYAVPGYPPTVGYPGYHGAPAPHPGVQYPGSQQPHPGPRPGYPPHIPPKPAQQSSH